MSVCLLLVINGRRVRFSCNPDDVPVFAKDLPQNILLYELIPEGTPRKCCFYLNNFSSPNHEDIQKLGRAVNQTMSIHTRKIGGVFVSKVVIEDLIFHNWEETDDFVDGIESRLRGSNWIVCDVPYDDITSRQANALDYSRLIGIYD